MKKIVFTLLAVCATLALSFAQSTSIKVELLEEQQEEVKEIKIMTFHEFLYDKRFAKELALLQPTQASKKVFEGKVKITKPQKITILVNKELRLNLLAFPDDKITIALKNDGSATFSESSLAKVYQTTYNAWDRAFLMEVYKLEGLEWKRAFEVTDSLWQLPLTAYNTLLKEDPKQKHPVYDAYFREKALTSKRVAAEYLLYGKIYATEPPNEELQIPTQFADFGGKPKAHTEEDYIINGAYIEQMTEELKKTVCAKDSSDKFKQTACLYDHIQTYPVGEFRRLMSVYSLNNMLGMVRENGGMDKKEVAEAEKKLASLQKDFPGQEDVTYLDDKFKRYKSLFAGQPAPNLALKDSTGKEFKLSDFKGKMVLLDFWATWCGPCMREVPFSKKLEEEFADKGVAFVYVCMSSQEETWKKTVAKKKMGGRQLFATPEDQKVIAKDFSIEYYPTYMLIDKAGNIITQKIRPSQNAKEVIQKALGE